MTFTCEGGYQFSDGSASQERSCENTGELSGELQECAGMHLLVQIYISKHAFVIVFCCMFAVKITSVIITIPNKDYTNIMGRTDLSDQFRKNYNTSQTYLL